MKRPRAADDDPAAAVLQRHTEETDCDTLDRRVFKNFSTACKHYSFPGSHQVGSYGPKGTAIVRTYSNATHGKDIVLDDGEMFLYRLKDDKLRTQFEINRQSRKPVRIFRKVSMGVMELGLFTAEGFVTAEAYSPDKFGREFVKFVRAGP